MAPEQLKGAEVTVRSDLYALGLVLYELFTGRKPYDAKSLQELLSLQEAAQLTSMTSIAADVDPQVERVIRQCLDPDPLRRPPSALAVSAALPGGDPLAAALAAGETPSPELVASAGKTEGMDKRYSVPLVLFVLVCLASALLFRQRDAAMMQVSLDNSPDVLAARSREIAAALGYAKRPADTNVRVEHRRSMVNALRKLPQPHKWSEWLTAEAPLQAEYREALQPLIANPSGEVTRDNPVPLQPGMVHVEVDGDGKLLNFWAVPYATAPGAAVAADAIFQAARLDSSKFTEVTPNFTPTYASDQLKVWQGPHPVIPNTPLIIEAAWWKGQVTEARIRYPWTPAPGTSEPGSAFIRAREITAVFSAAFGLLFVVLLARRNWKLNRVDKRGALRVAAVFFIIGATLWVGRVHAVPQIETLFFLVQKLSTSLMGAAVFWLLYLALEPALRARWPHSIVTWNRLLGGRWLDAQVGSHILIGAAVGCLIWVGAGLVEIGAEKEPTIGTGPNLKSVQSPRAWVATHAETVADALGVGFIGFFTIFGLRQLFRRDLYAALAASVMFTFFGSPPFGEPNWPVIVAIYFTMYLILNTVLLRYGLVTIFATAFFINSFGDIVLGLDWKTWYAPYGLATLLLLMSIAVFAFWRSLGARSLVGPVNTDGL